MDSESLSDKLKRLGVFSGSNGLATSRTSHQPIDELLCGKMIETPIGTVVSVEKLFPIDYCHGTILMDKIQISPIILNWSKPSCVLPPSTKVVFLDTETSGLAGGAGTFAFMIGCGFMTVEGFKSIQLFMPNPESEPALLYALNRLLFGVDIIVTFNGKSFDLPIIMNRYVLHRLSPVFKKFHHIDILHLARKIWRERLSSRRLGELEREILQFPRTEEDIPGWMVPEIYIDYLSTNDPAPLTGVFYHNCMDILSLGAIMNYISIMIDNDAEYPHQHISERMAIARLYDDQNLVEGASKRYQDILSGKVSDVHGVIAYTKLAKILRWQGNLSKSISMLELAFRYGSLTAAIDLAKIFEHNLKDNRQALKWTEKAIREGNIGRPSIDLSALDHRRNRLLRKISNQRNYEEMKG